MTLLALLSGQQSPVPPVERVAPEVLSAEEAGFNFEDPPAGCAVPVYDRALGWYFEGEDVVISWTDGADIASWELRDYEGEVVAQGTSPTSPLNLGQPGVGWYKLYFTRATDTGLPWGTNGGETTFIVSRTGFGMQDTPVAIGQEGAGWVSSPTRAYIGSGLVRLDVHVNSTDRASWRASLDEAKARVPGVLSDLDLAEPGTGNDRLAFIQFTRLDLQAADATELTELEYQIRTTVSEMVAIGVTHFEGRNEPMTSGLSGTWAATEYAIFAPWVRSQEPTAKVLGPCLVTINPINSGLTWFEDFLLGGGGANIDVVTFHVYNATSNDINQGRRVYAGLIDLLVQYGQETKPRWMTEWGTHATVYGSYEHRWQAQMAMMELHLLWQHGIHRNHTMYYYDFNVGYWAYPSALWSNNRGRKCPNALPLLWRTWVEETWGMDFIEPLDFGDVENRHWIGSRFRDAATMDECLTIQGSGRNGEVALSVTGAPSITVVDHLGRTALLPVTGGLVSVECGPEPVHVRVPSGVSATVVPASYGTDVTPVGAASFSGSTGGNGLARAMDGLLQNSYEIGKTAGQGGVHDVWMATEGDYLPAWWTAEFPERAFDIVEVICPPPWQGNGSLLDFDIEVEVAGAWQTVHTETVPAPGLVWASDKATSACWSDSFWDRRRIFVARLASPVTATGLRIWARDVSWGGSATIDQKRTMRVLDGSGMGKQIGQGGPKRMTIQEVSLYLS